MRSYRGGRSRRAACAHWLNVGELRRLRSRARRAARREISLFFAGTPVNCTGGDRRWLFRKLVLSCIWPIAQVDCRYTMTSSPVAQAHRATTRRATHASNAHLRHHTASTLNKLDTKVPPSANSASAHTTRPSGEMWIGSGMVTRCPRRREASSAQAAERRPTRRAAT